MNLISLIITAFCLSADAFAVSLTNGMTVKTVKMSYALKTGFFFGFFQALMPIIGWAAGISFSSKISSIGPWIAFVILSFIGGKMIYESRKCDCEKLEVKDAPRDTKSLFILAIATSIDALAVGVSFAFLNVSIISSAFIIGIITFCVCTVGVHFGKKIGCLCGNKAEVLGGCILILIGVKMLLEHLNIL